MIKICCDLHIIRVILYTFSNKSINNDANSLLIVMFIHMFPFSST